MIVSTNILEIANTQVDVALKILRQDIAEGRMSTVEDIAELYLNSDNDERHTQYLALLLAVALQRLAWK